AIASAKKAEPVAAREVKKGPVSKVSKALLDESDATKKAKNIQKSSIISIDNEKVLKLSFQWPIKGKVLKNFAQTDNKGIDIAGHVGQPVTAASAGKVAYSGQGLVGFGKLLIIKHNEQFLSAYANIAQIEVSEGQRVEKDQLIAKIGQVGSKKVSLHFEIRKNGKPVNPRKYLP
ncbi:MAG: peptidoglycan DD-metalloendopeptidase family protein, partial [Methylococcales bacterium]